MTPHVATVYSAPINAIIRVIGNNKELMISMAPVIATLISQLREELFVALSEIKEAESKMQDTVSEGTDLDNGSRYADLRVSINLGLL